MGHGIAGLMRPGPGEGDDRGIVPQRVTAVAQALGDVEQQDLYQLCHALGSGVIAPHQPFARTQPAITFGKARQHAGLFCHFVLQIEQETVFAALRQLMQIPADLA